MTKMWPQTLERNPSTTRASTYFCCFSFRKAAISCIVILFGIVVARTIFEGLTFTKDMESKRTALFPTIEDRIAYLKGNCSYDGCMQSTRLRQTDCDSDRPFVYSCPRKKCHGKIPNFYLKDMNRICQSGQHYNVMLGDAVPDNCGLFVKSRNISKHCGVLLPIGRRRHWNWFNHTKTLEFLALKTPFINKAYELEELQSPQVSWAKKKTSFVWRGATTGRGLRRDYVHALAPHYDVRFTNVVQDKELWVTPREQYMGRRYHPHEILAYKYVLSFEGNDVATNLKWLMAQDVVIVMPTPTKETWLMEGLLKPFVHYVPFDDVSSHATLLEWLRSHDEECRRIIDNANAWVTQLVSRFDEPTQTLMNFGALDRHHHSSRQRQAQYHSNVSRRSNSSR